MTSADYKPLFPWFGGKSVIAPTVWDALGNVDNYVEPFFGSGAALFLRPNPRGIETVNDADGFVANFWRAIKVDPQAVAEYADNPVNECDLHARHIWLVGERERITDHVCGDPDWYDAKAAGWWCWGLCCWIGGGWCSGDGPWISVDGVMAKKTDDMNCDGARKKLPHLGDAGQGVNRQCPHLGNAGVGVNRQRPHLGNAGVGVNRQRPHLGDAGQGVNRRLPHLGDAGRGVNRQRPHLGDAGQGRCAERRAWLVETMQRFADRLCDVRVCCGDWSRVCGPTPTIKQGLTGVFLDPPYSLETGRDMGCYAVDCGRVAHDVREWAIEWGKHPLMRIVLCDYGESEMPSNWEKINWIARGGYGSQGDRPGKSNRFRETLWFSPRCLKAADNLFGSEHVHIDGGV